MMAICLRICKPTKLCAIVCFVCIGNAIMAQSLSNVMPGFKHSWAASGSYGGTFDGKSWLWGVATDYSRFIGKRWILNGSLAFDQETTRKQNNTNEVENTLTLQFASGVSITKRLVLGGGFAKGIIDNKQGESKWKWKKMSEDWTVGALGVYTYWFNGHHSLDVTGSLEYRINEVKWAYSFDVGYGYSF